MVNKVGTQFKPTEKPPPPPIYRVVEVKAHSPNVAIAETQTEVLVHPTKHIDSEMIEGNNLDKNEVISQTSILSLDLGPQDKIEL